MKIIGTLDTKDDGDLLQEVLDQADGMFDAIYAYDDGSIDNTNKILSTHPAISKLWNRSEFSEDELKRYLQHRRGWLLEKIKEEYPYESEDIWAVRLEGDRFFLNQDPKEIVERAIKAEMDSRCGVMLDFRRHRVEGWGEADTWPNWHDSIRNIQRWFGIDDVHNVVAYKVADYIDYSKLGRPRPWPGGCIVNDCDRKNVNESMAFFEHHGRRGPKYLHWSVASGSRALSKKHLKQSPEQDYSTPETIFTTMEQRYQPYRLFPYINFDSVREALKLISTTDLKTNRQYQRYYFWGVERMFIENGSVLPPRTDI